jgi:hypothetical protein
MNIMFSCSVERVPQHVDIELGHRSVLQQLLSQFE